MCCHMQERLFFRSGVIFRCALYNSMPEREESTSLNGAEKWEGHAGFRATSRSLKRENPFRSGGAVLRTTTAKKSHNVRVGAEGSLSKRVQRRSITPCLRGDPEEVVYSSSSEGA